MLLDGKTALITGASGGIGEAFARQLAALGRDLVLVARSEDRLKALARDLTAQHGIEAHVIAADLARPSAATAVFAETQRLGLAVDLLVNNAGFGKRGEFTELPFDQQADMVRLNVNTLMELSRLYLPAMRQRQRGGIINVSSMGAFQPVPTMAVYGATKAFALSLSEALAEEVANDGVTVVALCPNSVSTGFQATAGVYEGQRDKMMTPDEAAAAALRAFEQRKSSVVPGLQNKLMVFISTRLLPRRLVARLARRVLSTQL